MIARICELRKLVRLREAVCSSQIRKRSTKTYLIDALSPSQNEESEADFKPQNILLLRKITRYEFEKKQMQTDSEDELKDKVSQVHLVHLCSTISCGSQRLHDTGSESGQG